MNEVEEIEESSLLYSHVYILRRYEWIRNSPFYSSWKLSESDQITSQNINIHKRKTLSNSEIRFNRLRNNKAAI